MVLSQRCPGGVPVRFRWCSCGVSVSQCWSGSVRCAGGVPVVSWSFPGGVPVVLQNVQWCLGSVPVVGVPVAVVSRVLCVSVVSQCCSPIATRFGVYFLHGLCSCLRPFSENVRFGVPSLFSCWCPGCVPVVSLWCCGGVPVVSRRCNGPVSVVSRWCPNGVPVVFLWCLGGVSVVSRCHIAGPVVSRSCAGGVPVVSRSCPVVSRWCCSVSSGVPVVSRWLVPQSCPGGVAVASRGVPVVSSGVLVVSRASWVLVVFHPVVSRSCLVFHAVVSRSRPPFRKI